MYTYRVSKSSSKYDSCVLHHADFWNGTLCFEDTFAELFFSRFIIGKKFVLLLGNNESFPRRRFLSYDLEKFMNFLKIVFEQVYGFSGKSSAS